MAQTADVVEGMVAQSMPTRFDHFEHFGVFADVVTDHKEGGLDAIMVEYIEHPGSYFGNRSVVKGEINGSFVLVHPPKGIGIEPAEKPGGLFDNHNEEGEGKGLQTNFVKGWSGKEEQEVRGVGRPVKRSPNS